MSKCLLIHLLRKSPQISMTFSRAFSCSKCLLANHYETLKISPNATAKEIKEAYFKLSKENHPDLNPNDPNCHERFIRLQEAYQVLSNPSSRKQYDVISGNSSFSSYGTGKRPYRPDYSARDEWIRRQNESMRKEMKYEEFFGKRYDDPRVFNHYYSRPQNASPEEMNAWLKKKQFQHSLKGLNTFFWIFGVFVFASCLEGLVARSRRRRFEEVMSENPELLERSRDPFYYDARFWEERDRISRERLKTLENISKYRSE